MFNHKHRDQLFQRLLFKRRSEMKFLTLSFSVLRGIGIFPSSSFSKWAFKAFAVYRVMIFFVTVLSTTLMTVQVFVAPDLTILARTIDMWTMFLSGIYKWFFMAMFSEEFAELKTTLKHVQSQGKVVYGPSANRFTANYLKNTEKVTFWYMSSGLFTVILLVVSPLITYPKGDRSDVEYFNDPKSYPVSFWIPFTVRDTSIFSAFFLLHSTALVYVVLMYLGIDSYMFGAIYAIGGQLEILNLSLNKIENSKVIVGDTTSEIHQLVYYDEHQQKKCFSILRECAKHHILILNYVKKIRVLFSTLIIVDYLHGITSLTFALFQLTISAGIGETISVIFFFIISVYHQYLNNYFGEYIIEKQSSVLAALYNVPWWRANKKIRQLLTMMICRSIKPTTITGFYMYKLSYESFLAFVKALYTYYMVLRRVNE